MTTFLERLIEIQSRVELSMNCELFIGTDRERHYWQIKCWRQDTITKEWDWGYGGKVYLSPHATDSELMQAAFGAYRAYWEHEVRETFLVDGVRPYGPHISLDALLSVARKVDVRSAMHVEDKV